MGQIEFVGVGSEKGEVSFGFNLSALGNLEKLGNDHRCITFTELENGVLAAGKKREKNKVLKIPNKHWGMGKTNYYPNKNVSFRIIEV